MILTAFRQPVARMATLLGLTAALAAPLAVADDLPRGYYTLPDEGDVVGSAYTVEAAEEDTLISIGHEHGIGYNAMVRANPDVSVWYPGEGTEVTIPGRFILPDAPRTDIVINVAEMRLYYYPPAEDDQQRIVQTYPLGVGRQDWETPLGTTTITEMVKNPAWYPPASIRREHAEAGDPLPGVVPPGPDNPLGTRKMRLGIPGYLIHGTNKPEGVGMRVSHGCVRMLPQDAEHLFDQIAVGTQVRIVNEPLKLGWSEGTLYAQSYPLLEDGEDTTLERVTAAISQADATIEGTDFQVDYDVLSRTVEDSSGMPIALVPSTPTAPEEPQEQPLPGSLYDQIALSAEVQEDAQQDKQG